MNVNLVCRYAALLLICTGVTLNAVAAPLEPVIERFGLQGFGAHSNGAEYVHIDSIEPRLCLASRMIMDVSQDKAR